MIPRENNLIYVDLAFHRLGDKLLIAMVVSEAISPVR